jgi:hypothetical protein
MQFEPTQEQVKAATDLENAIALRDGALVFAAMSKAHVTGFHPIHSQSLILLAEAPWHFLHEDVVRGIQTLRSPAAVEALERTAFAVHKYLDYDDVFALARKCTWALADIGTPEARMALKRLTSCNNPMIAGFAQKRLMNWQKEMPRKGYRPS